MLTFEQFLISTAEKGEAVNLVFEQRLFDLVGVLHKIAGALPSSAVPHELVGGLAVLVHVEESDPEHSMMTGNVDLMIARSDMGHLDHGKSEPLVPRALVPAASQPPASQPTRGPESA